MFLFHYSRSRLVLWLALAWACLSGQTYSATLPTNFVETAIGGTWNEAVGLTFAPEGHMFVWERGGRVWIVENNLKLATPFLDIHDEVGGWRDFGLLGFALDPNYAANGYVYLLYVVDHHHLTKFGTTNYNATTDEYFQATIGRITRYTARATDGFHTVDPASRLVLLGESISNGIPILYESHGVGGLMFGSDGTLLASGGDGASYSTVDTGSASETYYSSALSQGIIKPKENVGAFRSQLVDSLNGKILRIDPATGDGLPGNPFYDAANPRSARSRAWALGFRNPCRMTLRPGTGSTNPAAANPGVIFSGDVGMNLWEDLNVCIGPGQNFGWPVFEGLEAHASYSIANTANQDAPNPLNGTSGCTKPYFYFRDLLIQDTLNAPSWPNSCNTAQQIPSSLFRFVHRRPALDWKHGTGPARTGIYSGNNAAVINVGAVGSPVSGPQFVGNCSIGGVWYTGTDFPPAYQNTYFHAEYGAQWIKSFSFDASNKPTGVQNFLDAGGGIVFVGTHPQNGGLYYISWATVLKKISYVPAINQPPVAVAGADQTYGAGPLTVQFSSAGSTDPDGFPLTYSWDFGDGSPTNSSPNPSHTFVAPPGVAVPFTVTLVVRDPQGAAATNALVISVNNTPPNVTITSPIDGCKYPMTGVTIYDLAAAVSDAESPAGACVCRWQTFLHHNAHEHEEPPDFNCATTTVISPIGCDAASYYYRITLTVTDSGGLSTTREVRLYPDCPNQSPTAYGLLGEYYDNVNLTGLKLTRIDPAVNFDWTSGSPDPAIGADTFSTRWTGKLLPQFDETYTFSTTSDDGIRLWIDNNLVIDSWVDQSPTEHSGSITLKADVKSDLKLEHYENGGGAVAKLAWSSPSTPKVIVPAGALFPPQTPYAFQQDAGPDALVVIEAENNSFNLAQGGKGWTNTSTSGASGSGALQALSNDGTNVNAGYATNSPRLDFPVSFVRTGTHYLWVRGQGPGSTDQTVHAGLDGAVIATADRLNGFSSAWAWSKNTLDAVAATITVSNPGIHIVNLWMREDGFIVDKLLLTTNASYAPSGTGPAENLQLTDAPPTLSDLGNQTIAEDSVCGPLNFTVASARVPLNDLILAGSSSNPTLVSDSNIFFGGCGANRTVTVIPTPNQSGTTTITVTVNDGATNASDTFLLTVTAINDPPVATNDAFNVLEDGVLIVVVPGVLDNDTDADGNPLTVILVSGPTHGALTLNTNGSFAYTPSPGFVGSDNFSYRASDGQTDSQPAIVSLTVEPAANLSLAALAAPNPVVAGYALNFTIAVTNYGPHTASDVTLSDLLPPTFVFVSAEVSQGNYANDGGTFSASLGGLASGDHATLTLRVKPALGGNFTNLFSLTAHEADPDLANNVAALWINVRADSDGDGLPDDWEIVHGLLPNDATDAALDADGDGMSNLEEYLAGTDPTSPTSVFRIESLTLDDNRQIHFQSATGRLYTLYFGDAVTSNSWMAVPWQSRIPGQGAPQFLRDTNPAPPFRSYRLGVELP